MDTDTDSFSEPRTKPRRFNLFSKTNKTIDGMPPSVYWPRDLLPTDVPDARVLTFGYDTTVKHWAGAPPRYNTVRGIAGDFLVALESERREDPTRPLLFVVHSLGGIAIKEMLRKSNRCHKGQDHLRDVFFSTVGVIFFGTPHGGADPRGLLHHAAESFARAVGFTVNDEILNNLLPSSEHLRELRDEFNPLAHDQKWTIHSFQEELGMKSLRGRKVCHSPPQCLTLTDVDCTPGRGR